MFFYLNKSNDRQKLKTILPKQGAVHVFMWSGARGKAHAALRTRQGYISFGYEPGDKNTGIRSWKKPVNGKFHKDITDDIKQYRRSKGKCERVLLQLTVQEIKKINEKMTDLTASHKTLNFSFSADPIFMFLRSFTRLHVPGKVHNCTTLVIDLLKAGGISKKFNQNKVAKKHAVQTFFRSKLYIASLILLSPFVVKLWRYITPQDDTRLFLSDEGPEEKDESAAVVNLLWGGVTLGTMCFGFFNWFFDSEQQKNPLAMLGVVYGLPTALAAIRGGISLAGGDRHFYRPNDAIYITKLAQEADQTKNTAKKQTDLKSQNSDTASKKKESIRQTMSCNMLKGLKFQKILADGDCLFRAVAFSLKMKADDLRHIIAARMKCNADDFKEFKQGTDEDFQEHINAIGEGKEWGDAIEIEVIQRLISSPIIIVQANGNPVMPDKLDTYKNDPIFIYYNGVDHYDAFIVQGDNKPWEILHKIRQIVQLGQSITVNHLTQSVESSPKKAIIKEKETGSSSKSDKADNNASASSLKAVTEVHFQRSIVTENKKSAQSKKPINFASHFAPVVADRQELKQKESTSSPKVMQRG